MQSTLFIFVMAMERRPQQRRNEKTGRVAVSATRWSLGLSNQSKLKKAARFLACPKAGYITGSRLKQTAEFCNEQHNNACTGHQADDGRESHAANHRGRNRR